MNYEGPSNVFLHFCYFTIYFICKLHTYNTATIYVLIKHILNTEPHIPGYNLKQRPNISNIRVIKLILNTKPYIPLYNLQYLAQLTLHPLI